MISKSMKHIKQFNMSYRKYKVKWFDGPIEDKYCGSMHYSDRVISMHGKLKDDDTFRTFLHEVLHCASIELGTNLTEGQIESLSSMLAQALLTAKG